MCGKQGLRRAGAVFAIMSPEFFVLMASFAAFSGGESTDVDCSSSRLARPGSPDHRRTEENEFAEDTPEEALTITSDRDADQNTDRDAASDEPDDRNERTDR